VGAPEDLVEGVARGVDIFDCALPTRLARNGALLTRQGRLNIRNAQYTRDPAPVEAGCTCYTCRHFSRAYLRHLARTEEVLGLRLNTIHNVHFMIHLMSEIRAALLAGTFPEFREAFWAEYTIIPYEVRRANREARKARMAKHTEVSK